MKQGFTALSKEKLDHDKGYTHQNTILICQDINDGTKKMMIVFAQFFHLPSPRLDFVRGKDSSWEVSAGFSNRTVK